MQIILWSLGAAFIAYLSRRSLAQSGSHGFYRFFAWEAILALASLSLPRWFDNPSALHQIISWILLLVSIIPLFLGIYLLREQGESHGQIEGSVNFAFENTTQLVTTGVYSSIRHPLYASLLYLAWGIYAKDPRSLMGLILAVVASLFLYFTASVEEEENVHSFGPEYEEYMKKTKRFIPHLF